KCRLQRQKSVTAPRAPKGQQESSPGLASASEPTLGNGAQNKTPLPFWERHLSWSAIDFSKIIDMSSHQVCVHSQSPFLQLRRVGGVAINRAVLPAAPNDAQPLEGNRSDGTMVPFAPGPQV